jgi:prephenate dehydrogenase
VISDIKILIPVAKLNEIMWTELFLENPDFLAEEIDRLVARLTEFSKVIKDKDEEKLCEMLKEGRIRKLEIDREIF